MTTPTRSSTDMPPTIRLLAGFEPSDPAHDVCLAVIRYQLEQRVGPITLVVDQRREGVELDLTRLFECDTHPAALFHQQVDDVAVDVRRRMRNHLDAGVDHIPATPLDVYITVVDDPTAAADHVGLRALRYGASLPTADLDAEFDRLADIIRDIDPAAATVQSQQLVIDHLTAELHDERNEAVRLQAAIARLNDTIDVLTRRRDDDELRRAIVDPS